MSEWYYAHDGKQSGPVPVSELQRLAGDGNFDPEKDLVWREGQPDWKPATAVPELESLFRKESSSESATATAPTAPASDSSSYETPGTPAGPATSYQAPAAPVAGTQSTGLAVASMVCGLIGLLACCAWYLSLPLCIAAIILGHIANSRFKSDPVRYGGKGFARAGMILGYVGSILSVLAAVFSIYIVTRTPEQLEDMEWLPPEFRERFQAEMERQRNQ